MSGFAGIVRVEPTGRSEGEDRESFARLAEALAFRGPDGLQQSHTHNASFAFSLLRTGPAPQEATQPVSLDGESWLVGDVRCDGRDELLRKLQQHEAQVLPDVSSEKLLLHSLCEFGQRGLPEITGDLSFAVWNQRERKLIAFRDLTGTRPFFYAHRGTALAFSNTLQALLALPWVSRELDEDFLANFLLDAPFLDQARSVYRSIRRLPAGHLLEYSQQGLTTRRIANMPVEEPLIFSRDAEYVEEFRRLLSQAVRDRLPEIETTILLSGGLDSTTLAACAVSLRNAAPATSGLRLRAYTVDSQPLYHDAETDLASRFAATLGIPCEIEHSGKVLPFTSGDGRDDLPPEPALDPYALLYNFYFRQIAKTSRVVFSGSGSDEVLRLQALPYLRYLKKKRGAVAPAGALAKFVISQRKLPPLGAGFRTRFRSLLGHKTYRPAFPPWFNEELSHRLDRAARWEALQAPPILEHPSNPVAYASTNDGSVASILETYDAFWTGSPLEVRLPFLDRRLTRFLLRVPAIPWAMEKHLLRQSQIGILPDEIRCRKKVPLQGDDVLLHRAAGIWNPVPNEPPSRLLPMLVNWEKLMETLEQANDDALHLHLIPMALDRWLKCVEKIGGFQ